MAFVVLFLSVQPALSYVVNNRTIECCDNCSKETATKDLDNDNNNHENNSCNPFKSCSCCFTNCPTEYSFRLDKISFGKQKYPSLKTNFVFSHCSDFWQPPRFA
jgi:hypothetical protein